MSQHEDESILMAQMGRTLRGTSRVVSRCGLGLPVVTEVYPLLEDGSPFPTLYYLTCPLARQRVSRLESAGMIQHFRERLQAEPEFAAAYRASQESYRTAREALLPALPSDAPRPVGGVGGTREGVKCLHAHFAHYRGTGGCNPVGAAIAGQVEPLDCSVPCVIHGERNPAWQGARGA